MDDFEDFQDVEYTEDKFIRGEALYYSTGQVAKILDIPDSKVRYYTTAFDEILHIEIINKQRKFTKDDIDKMRFILELKNEGGMSIKQIQEYCDEVSFDSKEGIQIKETNPLSIQTLAKALLEEQNKQLELFKEDMVNKMQNIMDNANNINVQNNEKLKEDIIKSNEKFKEDIAITVIDIVELQQTKRDTELLDTLKSNMETAKKQSEESSKKSLLQRIFNK